MELRRCLVLAIIWLTGGFLIALVPIGPYPSLTTSAVNYIQLPLRRSLEQFYLQQSSKRLSTETKMLEENGYPPEIAQIPARHKMSAREFWVFPGDLDKLGNQLNITVDPKNSRNQENGDTGNKEAVDPSDQWQSGSPTLIIFWEKLADDSRTRAKALNMPETFSIFLKTAMLLGALLACPGILYSFWSFVAAGLYPNEKKYVYRFFPFSLTLFLGGFCFAFFIVFEFVLKFLLRFNAGMNIDPDPRISEWLSFAIMLPLGFGVAFQLPLVMFVLERLQIFTIRDYIQRWKISVLVIAFLSMMVTPPDPWSMICMMVPLIGLYFGGVFMCWIFPVAKHELLTEEK